jgi:hypothetical protein
LTPTVNEKEYGDDAEQHNATNHTTGDGTCGS